MRISAAEEQTHPGGAPDHADAGGTAGENDLAEEAEQDLRRPAAGRPADVQQRDAQHERLSAQVTQPVAVFAPRFGDILLGQGLALGTEVTLLGTE